MPSNEQRNARARDNQRLSRARRMEYIASLESKIRQFESEGVAASQLLQTSARAVEKQNSILRHWLCRATGVREAELQDWFKAPADVADRFFSSHLGTRRAASRSDGSAVSLDMYKGTPRPIESSAAIDRVPVGQSRRHSIARPVPQEQGKAWTSSSAPLVEPWLDSSMQQDHRTTKRLRTDTTFAFEQDNSRDSQAPTALYCQTPQVPTSYPLPRQTLTKALVSHTRHTTAPKDLDTESQGSMSTLNQPLSGGIATPHDFNNSPITLTDSQDNPWSAETDLQFPNFLSLLGSSSFIPSCGSDLSETGQQFCMLLSLLAPTSSACGGREDKGAVPRQLTCRESYQALQHILGGRMTVEEVVGKLMKSATMSEKDGSMVDVNVVKEILDSVGVEAGGTCARLGRCC